LNCLTEEVLKLKQVLVKVGLIYITRKMKTRVIAWWSGGIASALACWLALQIYKNVVIVFIDTKNEDEDTYRFLKDCEKLYEQKIVVISNDGYDSIEQVWLKYQSLNSATGAICSSELKRTVRERYQNLKIDYAQIFGFDINEVKRHLNMRKNYPELNVISPLIENGLTKAGVVREFIKLGIEIPRAYKLGYQNNNCLKTLCVQGGIGYYHKAKRETPEKVHAMAIREHALTDLKGEPVTVLRNQTNERKGEPIFLEPHPKYPQFQCLDDKKGIEPESLIECNGFCSTES
jgi:PP-loop superfamily ATP-utilizing enzyme